MPRIDALQKYRNQLLSAFDAGTLQNLKYANWTGLLEETDRLYSTMYHDWDVLQKDSSDIAEAVQSLEWTVAPYVADGEEAEPKAQAVARVVTDALWKRTPQRGGSYSHSFTQLLGAITHALYRGFNVHEIEWVNNGELVYPAAFHQLPPQFMRWEDRAGEVDRLLFVPDGEAEEPRPFPEHKYLVALNTSGPDHPIYNALYYPLIAWYGAFKFGLGWFMEYCQKYGLPKLVFRYESDRDRQQLEKDLAEERVLNNILLKGDRAVDIANAPASGASLPQRELLNLAESQCHKLLLGQTLTSDTSEHGGSLAQAKVHAGVQADVVKKRADFVADVLNSQLIPAIVLLNFGTLDVPMPELRYKIPQEGITLERVQVVKTALEIKGMKLKKSEVYEFTGFSQPTDDDDVFEAAAEPQHGAFGAPNGPQPPFGGKGPQEGPQGADKGQKPQQDAHQHEQKSDEAVSAARADGAGEPKIDPGQAWVSPIRQHFEKAREDGTTLEALRDGMQKLRPDTKALARAFAGNIMAGFRGEPSAELMSAANPYGCNQYGEGWKQPHNGAASKPGAPVKKGASPAAKKAEEDAQKKADEEAKQKAERIAKKKAQEEAAKKAQEEGAKKQAEEEAAKKKAEEEAAQKKAEEDAAKSEEEKAKSDAEKIQKEGEAIRESISKLPPPASVIDSVLKAVKNGKQSLSEVWSKLTPEQRKVIVDYTGWDYESLNNALRKNEPSAATKNLVSALNSMRLGEDYDVSRGSSMWDTKNMVPPLPPHINFKDPKAVALYINGALERGEELIFDSKAPTSTTLSNNPFSGYVQRLIHMKAGTRGACIAPVSENEVGGDISGNPNIRMEAFVDTVSARGGMKESEILLAPHVRTRIVRAGYVDGRLYIEEEVID